MSQIKDRIYHWIAIGIVGFTLGTSLVLLIDTQVNWPGADELVFTRLTMRLPDYQTHAEWWTPNGDIHPTDWLTENSLAPDTEPSHDIRHTDSRTFFDAAYTMPVWWHPPLASYLSWPAVKLLFSEEDVRGSFVWLRLIAWLMLAGCIGMTYRLIRKRTNAKSKWVALAMLPLLPTLLFLTYKGNNWFYPTIFMLLFLTIALTLRESPKYKKYIYIPLALMVASEIYGVVFLLPFIIENRKTAYCALAFMPYWIQAWVGGGSPLYLWHQWQPFALIGTQGTVMIRATLEAFWLRFLSGMEIAKYFLIIISPFLIYSIYKLARRRMKLLVPLLFVLAASIGLTWGPCAYHMIPFMVLGPLLAAECLHKKIESEKAEA